MVGNFEIVRSVGVRKAGQRQAELFDLRRCPVVVKHLRSVEESFEGQKHYQALNHIGHDKRHKRR